MRAVLAEADARGVPVRRVSQGSGVMMLTDVELDEMAQLGQRATESRCRSSSALEGHGTPAASRSPPRPSGSWPAAARASTSASRRSREASPTEFARFSSAISASWPRWDACAPPVTCHPTSSSRRRSCSRARTAPRPGVLQDCGATTINVSTDLSVDDLGEIRAACTAPLDVYVEAPGRPGRVRSPLRGAGR